MPTKMTKTIRAKRKRRKRKPPPPDVLEFVGQLQRLERNNIPILPDHPKPH